jgi:hypothetical protein
MKPGYISGKEARKNFEETMSKLFHAPKPPKKETPPKKAALGEKKN